MSSRELHRIPADKKAIVENYIKNYPVRLGDLAKSLGVSIKISSLGTGVSGQISLENDQFTIRVNRNESRERQRFTIAHELAHFLLHQDYIRASPDGITDNVLYRSGAPENIEYEANRLGAEIVMPTHAVSRELDVQFRGIITEETISGLASIFEVSKSAMEIKLSSFASA